MRCACEAVHYFNFNKHVGQFLEIKLLSLDEIDGTVKSLTSSLDFILEENGSKILILFII